MDSAQNYNQDVEQPLPDTQKTRTTSFGIAFSEAAALLTVWSLLVINEGSIRFNNLTPYGDFSNRIPGISNIPLGVAFFASLFEVIFGWIGLFVGIAALVCRYYNTALTKVAMLVQVAMGWYVFAVYVFAIPAKQAADLVEPILGLSMGTSRFLITLGLFTSFHFCLALQGGQLIFFARLVSAATGQDFLKQNSGYKMRATFWNGNMALAGLWTFITGCIINAKVGSGTITGVFMFPPNVGRLPGLTIFTGLLMLVWGLCGMALGFLSMTPGSWYYLGTGVVYLLAFLNFVLVQFGKLDDPASAGVAMHAGLIFMVVFLGPYFVYRLNNQEQHEMVA